MINEPARLYWKSNQVGKLNLDSPDNLAPCPKLRIKQRFATSDVVALKRKFFKKGA
jgi:hypothetical protein